MTQLIYQTITINWLWCSKNVVCIWKHTKNNSRIIKLARVYCALSKIFYLSSEDVCLQTNNHRKNTHTDWENETVSKHIVHRPNGTPNLQRKHEWHMLTLWFLSSNTFLHLRKRTYFSQIFYFSSPKFDS